jgi:hypothetical protein
MFETTVMAAHSRRPLAPSTTMLTTARIQALRSQAQRLDATRRPASVHEVVSHLVALQAQDVPAGTLGVGARADRLTVTDVDRARNVERSIVRTWCLRGTLHLVAAADVRWLLEIVRPGLEAANRTRRRELGLDDEDTARGVALLRRFLADGPRARGEIAVHLAEHGVASHGQATIHVIWRAAIDGLVCCGPDRASGGEPTFVLLDDWVARDSPPADPVGELVRRYRVAYGPATVEDFMAWSGLGRRLVDRAWSDVARDEIGSAPRVGGAERPRVVDRAWSDVARDETGSAPRVGGAERPREVDRAWSDVARAEAGSPPRAASDERPPEVDSASTDTPRAEAGSPPPGQTPTNPVRLLPAFDAVWLAYRDHAALVAPEFQKRLFPGGGVLRPIVFRDGRAVGTWTRRTTRRNVDVRVELFEHVPRSDLEAAVADLARFLESPARLLPGPPAVERGASR